VWTEHGPTEIYIFIVRSYDPLRTAHNGSVSSPMEMVSIKDVRGVHRWRSAREGGNQSLVSIVMGFSASKIKHQYLD
jgi:hypothetical protein